LTICALSPDCAPAQDAGAAAEDDTSSPDGSGAPQSEFLEPRNLLELSPQYRVTNGDQRPLDTYRLNLRANRSIPLDQQWTIGLRFDAPYLVRNPLNASNPSGDFIGGVGNVDAQAVLVRKLNERWSVGGGVRIYAPTGGEDFGNGKWVAMPGAAFRYALPEISGGSYFEPELRYAQSVAGDPARRTVSNLQFAPTVNFGLPHRWFFTLYPSNDIRLNFGDPINGQTGRLFLPFDAKIGKNLSDRLSVSFEAGAPIIQDYPVYKFKALFNITARY
jgi:hypothetical protein